MNAFSAEWLQLRAPFDSAARSTALIDRFAETLRAGHHTTLRLVDLAAGNGAGFMALAPAIGGDQDWLLVDHDPLLLAAQADAIVDWAECAGRRAQRFAEGVLIETGGSRWQARSMQFDLARSLENLALADCHGVTTSAFLDLVPEDWIDRLCALLSRHRVPLLAMLTVDGRRIWQPVLPEDATIDAAFRRHQSGDKGFGLALGERAGPILTRRLVDQGHTVQTARSDWNIAATHPEMLLRMVAESVSIAKEMEPALKTAFDEWAARRMAQIHAGALTLQVGHLDILALPHDLSRQER